MTRAKNHDQRKGQWLVNKIRTAKDFPHLSKKDFDRLGFDAGVNQEKAMVEMRLWYMENDEFDKMMGDYND